MLSARAEDFTLTNGDEDVPSIGSPFLVARVYTRKPQPKPQANNHAKESRKAWIALTSAMRWKYSTRSKLLGGGDVVPPEKFTDFSNANCLTLDRLKPDASSEDLQNAVYLVNDGKETALVVRGTHLLREVELVVCVDDGHESELVDLESVLRVRIAPSKLLYNLTVSMKEDPPEGLNVSELRKQLVDLSSATKYQDLIPDPSSTSEHKTMRGLKKAIWFTDHVQFTSDAMKTVSDVVDRTAAIVKRLAPAVACGAQNVSEVTKCVGIVSSAFQLIALGVQLGIMVDESHRGKKQFPELCELVLQLQCELSKCFEVYLQPSTTLDEIQLKNAFEVQEETFKLMASIEKELMRSAPLRVTHSGNLKTIETAVDYLKQKVLLVRVTGIAQQRQVGFVQDFGPLPPRPSLWPFFSGRDAERDSLINALENYGSAAILQHGGAGKTQLMVHLCEYLEKRGRIPGGAFWFVADGSEQKVIASLADFVQRLSKRELSEEDRVSLPLVVSILRSELSKRRGRWLLCLDNADDPTLGSVLGEIRSIAHPRNGWVVITSRQGGRTLWPGMCKEQMLTLGPLPEEMATVVLWRMKSAKTLHDTDDSVLVELEAVDDGERSAMKELCRILGYLALALTQAGSYVCSRGMTFACYLQLFQDLNTGKDLENLLPAVTQHCGFVHHHQRAVLTTWKINVDSMREDVSALAVLRLVALLGSTPVPEPLVKRILLTVQDGKSSLNPSFLDVKSKLINEASLLSENEAALSVHPLIRKFVLFVFEADGREDIETGTVSIYTYIHHLVKQSGGSVAKPILPLSREVVSIIPHVSELLHQSLELSTPLENDGILDKLHCLHCFYNQATHSIGRYCETESISKRYLKALKLQFGVEAKYPRIASAMGNLGAELGDEGNLLQAKSMLEGSLEMWREVLNDEADSDLTTVMRNLAWVLRKLGMFHESETMLQDCLTLIKRISCDPRGRAVEAGVLHDLGMIQLAQGLLTASKQTLTDCLEMKYNLFGKGVNHPDIAMSLRALGSVLRDQGELPEAEKSTRKALLMFRELYGQASDHPETASCLNLLGTILRQNGNILSAETLCSSSLAMNRRLYSNVQGHPNIASSLNCLANVKRSQGNCAEANNMYQESLQMNHQLYGESANHPHVTVNLQNLGWDLLAQGSLTEAESMLVKCLEMRQRLYGEFAIHPHLAEVSNLLGIVYLRKGELQVAKDWFQRALDMNVQIHREFSNNASIIANKFNLACLRQELGYHQEAEEGLQTCLAMRKNLYGKDKDHPRIASDMWELARVKLSLGKVEQAEKLIDESLQMNYRLCGEFADHSSIAKCLRVQALILCAQGSFLLAKRRVVDSLGMFYRLYGENADHPCIVSSMNTLGLVLWSMGSLPSAAERFREASDMDERICSSRMGAFILLNLYRVLRLLNQHLEAENCLGKVFRFVQAAEKVSSEPWRRELLDEITASRLTADVLNELGCCRFNHVSSIGVFRNSVLMFEKVFRGDFYQMSSIAPMKNLAEVLRKKAVDFETRLKILRKENHSSVGADGSRSSEMGPYQLHLRTIREEKVAEIEGELEELRKYKYPGAEIECVFIHGDRERYFVESETSACSLEERIEQLTADVALIREESAMLTRLSKERTRALLLKEVNPYSMKKMRMLIARLLWYIVRSSRVIQRRTSQLTTSWLRKEFMRHRLRSGHGIRQAL